MQLVFPFILLFTFGHAIPLIGRIQKLAATSYIGKLIHTPAQLPRRLVLFVLIQKGPKKSRQKKASPHRLLRLARFSVRPLRFLSRFI